MSTKVCNRCQLKKLTSDYSKRKLSLNGLQSYCKYCSKTYLSKWQNGNREHYNDYMRKRYKNNEGHRIAQLNRQRVHKAVNNNTKCLKTLNLTGASSWEFINKWFQFTRDYINLEPGVEEHIDHFIPCAKFDFSDPERQRECFS